MKQFLFFTFAFFVLATSCCAEEADKAEECISVMVSDEITNTKILPRTVMLITGLNYKHGQPVPPDSPSEVGIVLTTEDGQMWVAIWVKASPGEYTGF